MSANTQGAEAAGKFITFEGIDGAGKSTHIGWFAETLREKLNGSARVVLTREPGGTALGESLRDLLLHRTMQIETEALLMFAARREHLAEVIEPALQRGDWVISDRFTDASFAYQGAGRGLTAAKLQTLEHWVHPGRQPDVTVLFDLPVEVARARLSNGRVADRFEQHDGPFFERVRNEYLRRASVSPARFRLIDGSLSIERIRKLLRSTIETLIDE